jgi:hypothetical protein
MNAGENFDGIPPKPACLQPNAVSGLGAQFVNYPGGGAVAYLGYTDMSDLSAFQGIYLPFLKEMSEGEGILGNAFNYSIKYYYDDNLSRFNDKAQNVLGIGQLFKQPLIYILFGDPSLRIGGIKQ